MTLMINRTAMLLLLQKTLHTFVLMSFFSPVLADISWIVFSEKALGPSTKISAIADEQERYQLSHDHHWRDFQLDVSRSGDIIFSSNRKKNFSVDLQKRSDNYNIHLFDAKTGAIDFVTQSKEQDFYPKFNHCGSHTAFLRIHSKNKQSLQLLDHNQTESTTLIQAKKILSYDWARSSASLAASIVQNNTPHILIFDTERYTNSNTDTNINNKHKVIDISLPISDTETYFVDQVSWSPNGKLLAYIKHPLERSGVRTLWIYNVTDKTHKQLSENTVQVQNSLDWSQDSKTILYSGLMDYAYGYDEITRDRRYSGTMPIFITDIEGETKRITSGNALHLHPRFSPNDTRIAYLYSEQLGDALFYELRTIGKDGKQIKTLHKRVSRDSNIIWTTVKHIPQKTHIQRNNIERND